MATPRLDLAPMPHGAGVAFSALFLGRMLEGAEVPEALSAATAAVFALFAATRRSGAGELESRPRRADGSVPSAVEAVEEPTPAEVRGRHAEERAGGERDDAQQDEQGDRDVRDAPEERLEDRLTREQLLAEFLGQTRLVVRVHPHAIGGFCVLLGEIGLEGGANFLGGRRLRALRALLASTTWLTRRRRAGVAPVKRRTSR